MIKHVKVVLTFPLGAKFQDNIYQIIYKKFVRFVKELMCFNIDSKCRECKYCNQCRYFLLFGENFKEYPGILIKNELFFNSFISKGEQKYFEFYFVGNSSIYSSYISLFFDSLKQNLLGNFFYLNAILIDELKETRVYGLGDIVTPVETKNITESYNNMVSYYNEKYDCNYMLIDKIIFLDHCKRVTWPTIHFVTKNVVVNGYIGGKLELNNFDSDLLTIGIGSFNFIGGGKIETEN